jgi:hypothetical protein
MKTYYKNFYGSTASIEVRSNGIAKLIIKTSAGQTVVNRPYDSKRGAKAAMNRFSNCWRKQKGK